jgi:hypothetical protein
MSKTSCRSIFSYRNICTAGYIPCQFLAIPIGQDPSCCKNRYWTQNIFFTFFRIKRSIQNTKIVNFAYIDNYYKNKYYNHRINSQPTYGLFYTTLKKILIKSGQVCRIEKYLIWRYVVRIFISPEKMLYFFI